MAKQTLIGEDVWVWTDNLMIKKRIKYVPYLYKMFDDILVSSAANSNHIRVKIDVENNQISVWNNNGEGVYDFSDAIFPYSTEFTVERANGNELSTEVFTHNNMETRTMRKCKTKWTRVSFKPNLEKFGMECLDDDIVSLMKRRVIDLAGCSSVKVQLHGTYGLPKTFKDYVEIYLKAYPPTTRMYEKVNDRWEIYVAVTDGYFEQFEQVSFVNNIATVKGGSHVDYITSQITRYLVDIVDLEPDEMKNYLWVFVNAHIDDPAFDSQTKENLTTNSESFGSKCELTEEFLKKIADSHVFRPFKSSALELDIPTLRDAYLANTPSSKYCTLIVTKGDLAEDIAESQLSVVGQDKYGVFPLEGKLLNVREASPQELKRNPDIQNIKKILGLEYGKIYKNVKELRYGHLMIMADEDDDGLQMKGLLINFLHYFWPSLLKVKNFLQMFIAPIVKASHKKTNKVFLFFSTYVYNAWKKKEKSIKDYNIKFYRGEEDIKKGEDRGKYYFDQRIKDFVWVNDKDDNAIKLAFSNEKIEERKRWLLEPEDVTNFDPTDKCIRYLDFINQEFKQYAMADIQRSIPSIVDGLTPCQREILFYAFKKPIIHEIEVHDFSCYVFKQYPYHDGVGEESLVENYVGTIIGMAQNYVGSNNINLFQPNGQFGTRVMGGKDHRSDTYCHINISPITQYIFHKDDELLLNYLNEGGQSFEPEWFIPIIPMVLVNGSEARGDWSSFIPKYNPRDIIANLKLLLEGKEMMPMLPWYKGFKGSIEETADTSYITKGKFIREDINNDLVLLTITEVPIMRWTNDYKKFLKAASRGGKDIKAYEAPDEPTSVHFEITMSKDQMNRAREHGEEAFLNKFKLTTTLSTANMHLFDKNGELKKYDTPQQILKEFFHLRLEFYEKRTTTLVKELKKDSLVARNKLRFINEVVSRKLVLGLKEKHLVYAQLEAQGFQSLQSIAKVAADYVGTENTKKEEDEVPGTGYDYLLSSLVYDTLLVDVKNLEEEIYVKEEKMRYLTENSFKSLWLKDLEALDDKLRVEYPLAENLLGEKQAKRRLNAAGESANKKRRMGGKQKIAMLQFLSRIHEE